MVCNAIMLYAKDYVLSYFVLNSIGNMAAYSKKNEEEIANEQIIDEDLIIENLLM